MKKFKAFIILILTIINYSIAQNVSFTASVKTPVGTGEQFRLVYTLNAQGSGFTAPTIRDFDVLAGPSQSSSSNISIVNGSVSQSVSTSYTYILAAKREGRFTIGPASVTANGKRVQSNSVSVEVVKGSPQARRNNQGSGSGGGSSTGGGGGKAFAKVAVTRTKVYQGEPIVAVAKVYTKGNLVGFSNMKFPSYNGFWTEEIKMPSQIAVNNEVIDGANYNVANMKKTVLFPQKSGNIDISGFDAECILREKTSRHSNNPFDDFFNFDFGGGYRDIKSDAKAGTVRITVIPLPEKNKPADFSGAVGKLSITSSINKKQVKTNEAITLKITISGSGNIKLIDKLPLAFPTDIETYDPKINDNITVNENGVNGSRTFEYLLIPRNAGDFKIKPVSFSYFDVDKKTYVTLNTNEFELTVEKGSGTESAVVTGVSKEDIKYIGNDIRFIKKKTSIKDRGLYFYNSVLFYLLLILPAILFIIFVLTWQRQIKQNSNLALVKNRKATKIANKRLKTASHYLKENKRNEFFEEVSRALWGYLSDKFSIPGSELNKDNVHDKLFSKKVSEETISLIIELLTNCEFERFAPSGETGRMDKIYEDAIAIISKIENEIK